MILFGQGCINEEMNGKLIRTAAARLCSYSFFIFYMILHGQAYYSMNRHYSGCGGTASLGGEGEGREHVPEVHPPFYIYMH